MNRYIIGLVAVFCCMLFAGCSSQPSGNSSTSSDITSSQPIEISPEELQRYFQQAFDAKGNALDTPEQVALELAEVKAQAEDALLPEDYKTQYKEWRSEHISDLLETLYEEYDKITADLDLFDGINSGAAYADRIDFDQDGIQELLLISLIPDIDAGRINGWDGSVTLYTGESGHAQPCGGETILLPSFYHSFDPKMLSLVQKDGRTYIHMLSIEGQNTEDIYYGVSNGVINIVDSTFSDVEICTSFRNQITLEEYDAIHAKYTDGIVILADTPSIMPVQNRGILPELPQAAQQRAAFLEVLENKKIKYAKLIDFDGDGINDLVTVEEVMVQSDYGPYEDILFYVYRWVDSKMEKISFENMWFGQWGEGGIYRKKSNGEVFLYCNDRGDGDGTVDITHQFRSIKSSEDISSADFEQTEDEYGYQDLTPKGAEEYRAALDKYEVIEEFELEGSYTDYSAITNAQKQLLSS